MWLVSFILVKYIQHTPNFSIQLRYLLYLLQQYYLLPDLRSVKNYSAVFYKSFSASTNANIVCHIVPIAHIYTMYNIL